MKQINQDYNKVLLELVTMFSTQMRDAVLIEHDKYQAEIQQ